MSSSGASETMILEGKVRIVWRQLENKNVTNWIKEGDLGLGGCLSAWVLEDTTSEWKRLQKREFKY